MARGVGGRGPANIMQHLSGINFPCSKRDIVEHARSANGPNTDQVVNVLQRIDTKEYHSPAEVMEQIGDVE